MAVSRSSTKSSTKSTPAPKSSATTNYSGIKKRSGAKKPPPAKPAERTMYIVTRETIDYHNDPRGGMQDNDVVGIFSSRNEANKAARTDLLNDWNMDFFESYEADEEDGLVTVTAVCPEGEEMTVTVKEAPNKMSLGQKKSSKSGMRKVYHVTRETIDYHNDHNGGIQDTAVVGTFFSRKEANQAARTDLLNDWNRDFFESYEVDEEDGLVTVTAVCPEGEEMTVTVEEGQLDEGSDEESDEESGEELDEESDEASDDGY
jgi:hypothetical protein